MVGQTPAKQNTYSSVVLRQVQAMLRDPGEWDAKKKSRGEVGRQKRL